MSDRGFIKHYSAPGDRYEGEEGDEDALYDHFTLRVTQGQRPVRLDVFLANLLPFTTRSKIKNAYETGCITVNARESKLSYKVRPGDEVKIMLPYPPSPELKAEDIPLDIRYEDEDMLILHKPAGMVCHPSLGHRSGTLVHALLWHFEHLPAGSDRETPRPGLVHRIDKDTTGLLVIAKTEYAMAHLSKQFFERTSDRRYIALVWGDLKDDKGSVVAHVGRHPTDRKIFTAFPGGEQGKHAVTHYEVIERFGALTLIQLKLETGRTHQIRVHMKHLGHTLFGDKDYGGDKVLRGATHSRAWLDLIHRCLAILPRQALHAKTLALDHPRSGERLAFDSELPADMEEVLALLRQWNEGRKAPAQDG
jgi:23S rRNA pseudouridine1911/1915/1917 synthase